MSILSLFWTFFQFGLVSFGGGYVLVPLLIAEFVNRRGIISMDAFGNLVSIAQVTPGPIGINSATYVGFTQGGFWGAVFASLGLVMPSIIIGSAAVYYINKWKEKLLVKGILKGVRSAALAMLLRGCDLSRHVRFHTGNPVQESLEPDHVPCAGIPRRVRIFISCIPDLHSNSHPD